MKSPPYLLKFCFENGNHHVGLWIPLFLIGPIVLVFLLIIFVILLACALLAFIFTLQWEWLRSVVMGVSAVYDVVSSLPGVRVDVDTPEVKVNISVY